MSDLQISVIDRLDTASFEELAESVQTSVAAAKEHARKSIEHLIEAGGALSEMRDRMPGQFTVWQESVGLDRSWVGKCIRLYTYQHQLSHDVYLPFTTTSGHSRAPSLKRAIDSISHLPTIERKAFTYTQSRVFTDEQLRVARLMIKDGVPRGEIAQLTGVSLNAIHDMANPASAKASAARFAAKEKERRAAANALRKQNQREERDRLAKATGKELSVAYAATRQALAALARMGDPVDRVAVDRASRYFTAAESAIVSAMQAERAS